MKFVRKFKKTSWELDFKLSAQINLLGMIESLVSLA